MIEGVINSEAPKEHWAYLRVRGARVLDLGCGFWTEQERKENYGTPHYFIDQKPDFYMGVDHNEKDIKTFQATYPEHRFVCEPVSSPDQVMAWINNHRITHLKADIECAEGHLFKMPRMTLEEVAVETHNSELHKDCQRWIEEIGMKVTRIDTASFCSDILIIYGK